MDPSRLRWLSLAALALLPATGAFAAVVGVRVVDAATGEPLPGAAVCLGTPAEPDQFGALRTDSQGHVEFHDIAQTPLQLTVSRAGYRGLRKTYRSAAFDRVLQVRLSPGGLGPRCVVPEAGEAEQDEPALAVDILGGPTTATPEVQLRIRVHGKATHYRVSEDPGFRGAAWLPYTKEPVTFRLSPTPGPKTLYVQIRLQREVGGGRVEIESEVVKVPVHYTGS
jgi:hypothetical protein